MSAGERRRRGRGVGVLAGLSLLTVLFVALLARLVISPSPESDIQQGMGETAPSAVAAPTSASRGSTRYVLDTRDYDTARYPSVEHLPMLSDVVAEVLVEEVLPIRYHTMDGVRSPSTDRLADRSRSMLFSPVLLRVTEYHQGRDIAADGFVVAQWGGETREVMHLVIPEDPFRTALERPPGPGVAFLQTLQALDGPYNDDSAWIPALRDIAEAKSIESGDTYLAAEWLDYLERDAAEEAVFSLARQHLFDREYFEDLVGSVSTNTYETPTPSAAYP